MLIVEEDEWSIHPDTDSRRQREAQTWKPINGKDDQKCAEYVGLFKELDLDWNYVGASSGIESIYLNVSVDGWMFSGGTYKGYAYAGALPIPLGSLTDDTNTRGLPMPRYRHIEDNWYIYFHRNREYYGE